MHSTWFFFFVNLFILDLCWVVSVAFFPSQSSNSCSALQSSAQRVPWHAPPASPDQSCENWPTAILLCVNEALSLFPFHSPCFIIVPPPEAGFSGWSVALFCISNSCLKAEMLFQQLYGKHLMHPTAMYVAQKNQAWCWQGWGPLHPAVAEFRPC